MPFEFIICILCGTIVFANAVFIVCELYRLFKH